MVDWTSIRTEYITTNTSYRKLGEKYGVHYKAVSDKGKAEGWVETRSQYRAKALTKTLESAAKRQAERGLKIITVADLLLDKVVEILNDDERRVDAQGLRSLASVLKDIREIQMIRSDADMKEQEARIAKLQKEAGLNNENEVRVEMAEEIEVYAE